MHCVRTSWLATFMCIGIRRKVHLIVFSVPETICEKHSKVASCLQECLYTVNNPRVQWSELLHWREIVVDLLYTNNLSYHAPSSVGQLRLFAIRFSSQILTVELLHVAIWANFCVMLLWWFKLMERWNSFQFSQPYQFCARKDVSGVWLWMWLHAMLELLRLLGAL